MTIANNMVNAPPIANEVSFYCRFFTDLSKMRDTFGHPLHEVDFRDDFQGDKPRRCPYPGNRNGLLMNQRALGEIVRQWNEIKVALAILLQSDIDTKIRNDPRLYLWHKSILPMFLPVFLKFTLGDDHRIPAVISGMFKIMLDIPTTIDLMLERDWSNGFEKAIAPSVIDEFADYTFILNNGEWTCAGPPQLIRDTLYLLSEPKSTLRVNEVDVFEYIPNRSAFTAFCLIMHRIYILSQIFQIVTLYTMEVAFGKLSFVEAIALESSAYLTRWKITHSYCKDSNSVGRIISGFSTCFQQLCTQDDNDSREESNQFINKALALITSSLMMSSAEILAANKQFHIAFKDAILLLQEDAAATIRVDRNPFKTNFSFLDQPRFPSQILRSKL